MQIESKATSLLDCFAEMQLNLCKVNYFIGYHKLFRLFCPQKNNFSHCHAFFLKHLTHRKASNFIWLPSGWSRDGFGIVSKLLSKLYFTTWNVRFTACNLYFTARNIHFTAWNIKRKGGWEQLYRGDRRSRKEQEENNAPIGEKRGNLPLVSPYIIII